MKRILIVDDDTDLLYVMEFILTTHDFIVKTTGRWSVIPKIIETFVPDLVLIDIDLNGEDGGSICKTLKQSKEYNALPIILFSIHNLPGEYVKECNAQGFLSKPFKSDDLIKIIEENLN